MKQQMIEQVSEVLLANGTPFSRFAYHLLSGEDEAAKAQLADDVVWNLMPNGAALKGKEQVYEFLKPAFLSVADRRPELLGNVSLGDWGVFEYWNVGTIDERVIDFARSCWGTLPADASGKVGQEFRIPVCFVYHVNAAEKVDLVREYMDTGSFVTRAQPRPATA